LFTYSRSTLVKWRNHFPQLLNVHKHFPQLLNVHGVNHIRQTEIHTAVPQVSEPRAFDVEMAIEKLKKKQIIRH